MTIIDEIAEAALEVFERVPYLESRTSMVPCRIEDATEQTFTTNLPLSVRMAIKQVVIDKSRLVEFYQELRAVYELPGFSPEEKGLIPTLETRLLLKARDLSGRYSKPWEALQWLLIKPSEDATDKLIASREVRGRVEGLFHYREEALRTQRETVSAIP